MTTLHETHICRDCGAAITIPYAKSGDEPVRLLRPDDIGCQYCWADPRYTKVTDDKSRRCPVCGSDYTGPRRTSLVALIAATPPTDT